MKLDIIVNKYLLMWHLLYQSSVSPEFHILKQDIWMDHKKEYSMVHADKDDILKERENFIPNDDFIYNILESNPLYKKIKIDTNKYRLNVMETWDLNKKKYNTELNNILRRPIKDLYTICVVHPSWDVVETNMKDNIITIGKKIILRDKDNFLTYLIYKITKNEIFKLKANETEILDTVCELAITNELYTRMAGESKYNYGKKLNRELKERIYPYWLMYLGVKEDEFDKYMVRDNIFFDKSKYKYEKMLKKLDIYTFIAFLVKNKKKLMKTKLVPIEEIEML